MRLRAAVLLVCVLLPSLVVTTIQAGQSPDGAAGPPPGGLVVVIPSPLQEDHASVLRAFNNPSISGVALQIRWRDLEPSAGKPDWSTLDQLFAAAQSAGKWVQLLIFPGFFLLHGPSPASRRDDSRSSTDPAKARWRAFRCRGTRSTSPVGSPS